MVLEIIKDSHRFSDPLPMERWGLHLIPSNKAGGYFDQLSGPGPANPTFDLLESLPWRKAATNKDISVTLIPQAVRRLKLAV